MKCCLFRSKWYWYHVPTVCFWKEVVLFHKVHIHLRLRLSGWRWNTLAIYFYIQRFSHKWTTHLVSFIINSYWHLISAISFLSTPNLQKYGSRSESSLTREILVFTLYTKRLKILKSHVLSTERIYVFCTVLRTNVIISLHSIYVFVIITRDGMFTARYVPYL